MHSRFLFAIIGFTALTGLADAQVQQRRATFLGGGNQNQGKCTVEVVVDGAAEVEIRGDTATLRNLRGQQPQWRRFECSGPMPVRPADFRFAGVDGRGRQQLMRDPRDGGSAVVQIEDPENGAEGYTFDLFWSANSGAPPISQDRNRPAYGAPDVRNGDGRYVPNGPNGNYGLRFSRDDAMRGCQDAVRQQAAQQFDARDIVFRRIQSDDNAGPRDRVEGVFDVRGGNGRDEPFRFSCSVNFDTGRVWNAQIAPLNSDRDRRDTGNQFGSPGDRAIRSCQNAVEQRLARDYGNGNVAIESIRVDDRPGRGDMVFGNARIDGRGNSRSAFTFSCSVDLSDGDVRRVDVQPR